MQVQSLEVNFINMRLFKRNVFSLRLDKINLDLDRDIHNPSFNPLVSYIVSYTSHSVPSIRTLLNAGKCSLLGC